MRRNYGIIAIVVIIAVIATVSYLFIKEPTGAQLKDSGTEYISYTCPNGDGITCRVTPELECFTQTTEKRVIFRAEQFSSFPSEIAIDTTFDGTLEALTRTTGTISQNICTSAQKIGEGFLDTNVIKHNNVVYVCSSDDNLRYISGGSIPTKITPVEPYASSGREIYFGSQLSFTCSEDVFVNSIKRETITYSGDVAGVKKGAPIILSGGDSISFSKIKYEVYVEDVAATECIATTGQKLQIGNSICTDSLTLESCIYTGEPELVVDKATGRKICINGVIQCKASDCEFDGIGEVFTDRTGYYECSIDADGCQYNDLSKAVFCDTGDFFDLIELRCKPPYKAQLTLDKTVIGTEDRIIGEVKLSETTEKDQVPVRIVIKKEDVTVDFQDYLTTSAGIVDFSLEPIDITGNYAIQAIITHPDGEQVKTKTFKVVPQLELILQPEPDYIQFDNEPVKIRASVKSGSNYESVEKWFVTAKFGTQTVSTSLEPVAKGRIIISADVVGEGELEFRVKALDQSGFLTEEGMITITVRKADIIIPIDIGSANNKETGTYNIKFTTLTPDNQLLNTDGNNKVTIILPNGCKSDGFCVANNKLIPEPTIQGSNGQYYFGWNFDTSGLYIIEIESFASGYELSKSIPTSVNIKQPTIEKNYLPLIIGIVVGIIVVVAVVILFLRRK